MNWQAECGHWMVVYSLEPTPESCPDCADKSGENLRQCLESWERDLSSAVYRAEDAGLGDAEMWARENGLQLSDEDLSTLQIIGDQISEASRDLDHAHDSLRSFIAAKVPPKVERLTMPSVAS